MISIIVAMSKNRVIGKDNKIPWHIPEDLKNFKKITTGHSVIMGRKTYESIGKALPNRTNFVISKNKSFKAPDAATCNSVLEAIQIARCFPGSEETFIIGGAAIFEKALLISKRIYLTEIQEEYEGDVFFPEFDESKYEDIHKENLTDKAIFRIWERVR